MTDIDGVPVWGRAAFTGWMIRLVMLAPRIGTGIFRYNFFRLPPQTEETLRKDAEWLLVGTYGKTAGRV